MRPVSAPPRLAREGFIPAGPEKRVNKRAMLIPKTGNPSDHLPTLMDFSEVICPAERRSLAVCLHLLRRVVVESETGLTHAAQFKLVAPPVAAWRVPLDRRPPGRHQPLRR